MGCSRPYWWLGASPYTFPDKESVDEGMAEVVEEATKFGSFARMDHGISPVNEGDVEIVGLSIAALVP
jgi:hypothetical protein